MDASSTPLAELLTDDVAAIAETLVAERAAVKPSGRSTEDVDLRPRIAELFANGDFAAKCDV